MSRKSPTDFVLTETESALNSMVRPGAGILLAVSGGSDSIGLMHLTALAAAKSNLCLAVGFVNHGLRKGVEKELDFVRKQAQKIGLQVHSVSIPKDEALKIKEQGSIQAWAREMRYSLLSETAKRLGMNFIATGHTSDDQAETVLLRLIRGTGLDGIAGIAAQRPLSEAIWAIRPLLKISRLDIRNWLETHGIGWIEDPSNMDPKYSRVRVRNELLPIMNSLQPGVAKRIAALSQEAKDVSDFLNDSCFTDKFILKNLRLSSGVKVDYECIRNLPSYIQSRIVRFAIRNVRRDLAGLERAHIEPIQKLIQARKTSGALPLPGMAKVYVDRGSLYVFPGPLPGKSNTIEKVRVVEPALGLASSQALLASVEIRFNETSSADGLALRTRRKGDGIWKSKKKLKEILIEKQIPRIYRDFVPLLARGDKIVSAPGLMENKDPDIEVRWSLAEASPMLDIELNKQHS